MGRIRNGLEKVLNWGKAAVVSLPLIAGVYGCEKEEPIKVNLEIPVTYGRSPLNIPVKLNGSGDNKITRYILTVDEKVIRNASYPLDSVITLRNDSYMKGKKHIAIVGEVNDSKGNVSKDYQYIKVYPKGVNFFKQPNDKNKNWYGSGDVNNDNALNSQDLDRLVAVINGTYSDPNDKRLYARADVNGDRKVDESDLEMIAKKLNGVILALPGEWNLVLLPQQRKDWFKERLEDDNTDKIPPVEDFNCDEHVYQLMMNFSGFDSEGLKKFKEVTPQYDTTKNCLYNIPIEFIRIGFYDVNNKRLGGHAIGGVIFGDESNIEEMCMFSAQSDSLYVDIGKDYIPSDHQRVWIDGPPVVSGLNQDGSLGVVLTNYLEYAHKDNKFNLVWTNSKIELVPKREE